VIDHVSITVKNLARSTALYAGALAPLGYVQLVAREKTAAFGKQHPEFWLNARPAAVFDPDTGAHLCLRAPSEDAVRAFHAAAVAGGCKSDRDPASYPGEHTTYFAAFIRDPDGNRVEAATFPMAAAPEGAAGR
jgi:catechol 2,3-dioxygenase-like lactoylglutathione lyase family enzyme